ncbi:MAG: FAD-dependent oxidoreductase [Oscillospiraceae bacterium]|nr:FAD-dependent oxidoreductase [Oscillospiraceae bacterium]
MEKNMAENFLFVYAGEFDDYGGWALDTQFIQNMGSSYLLAHGLGNPVANAVKKIAVKKAGRYKVWAYTKDWVARWKKGVSPGLFKVKIDDWTSETLGGKSASWAWQEAGICEIPAGEAILSLADLTGFEGRCAAVLLCGDLDFAPPDKKEEFAALSNKLHGYEGADPENAGKFDVIIAGGGIAGMCAAISAAKNGLEVALIQDRYVLGGNNSSEVRVWLGGETGFEPFPKIGDIVKSLEPEKHFHYGKDNVGSIYEDEKRLAMIKKYKNIRLFLGHAAVSAKLKENKIESVKFIDVKNGKPKEARAQYFVDCTGDATLGFLADADFEITTNGHMGMTNVWYVEDTGKETKFQNCPWAIDLTNCGFPGRGAKDYEGAKQLGGWYWESGMEHEPIEFAEEARDTNFRAMYGAFDALKNIDGGFYSTYKIGNACYIGGKRESRRLLGDVMLSKSEVLKNHKFEDGCIPSTWQIDVHYAKKQYYPSFHEGDAFLTDAYYDNFKHIPYFVPYRCLYSRNVANLFMAGRNVSVTHDALGTVRVMRTCGMMGEIVGFAAALCKKHGATPRDIYENHLGEFLEILKRGQL